MILIDTSGWIEFYRLGGSEQARERVAEAVAADQAATCGIVHVELLAFVRDGSEARLLDEEQSALHWLNIGREHYGQAVRLGRSVRSKGITVPATDLLVATAALSHSATLYHLDDHFRLIAKHSKLKQRDLRDA